MTTDGDNSNIVIGQMAQKQFDVSRLSPGPRSGARSSIIVGSSDE